MSPLFLSLIALFILVIIFIAIVRFKKRKSKKASQYYPENVQLYVGNLSYHVNAFQLKEFFSKFGNVQYAKLVKDTRTGRSKGFAFVTFSSVEEAKAALVANDTEMKGRKMVVRMAKPK